MPRRRKDEDPEPDEVIPLEAADENEDPDKGGVLDVDGEVDDEEEFPDSTLDGLAKLYGWSDDDPHKDSPGI
jgi:hypothetical protein